MRVDAVFRAPLAPARGERKAMSLLDGRIFDATAPQQRARDGDAEFAGRMFVAGAGADEFGW